MSFFSKLKKRLFKSSNKIESGISEIISETTDVELNAQSSTNSSAKEIADSSYENSFQSENKFISDGKANRHKTNFLGRLKSRAGISADKRVLDDKMLESLEELLISSDMGVKTALNITSSISETHFGKKLGVSQIKALLAAEILKILEPVAKPMPINTNSLQVVLVVGVNGSGKTTTIGKLAKQFRAANKSVMIAAGDTFRAAAVEQLEIWGKRAEVSVVKLPAGSDPASLAFDSITQAVVNKTELLMIDTAGRLQNRTDLMEELAKIVRVIEKKNLSEKHQTLLVLDASTGQNALSQVELFLKVADVSGLVMTKLDGSAKGGVLVAIAQKFLLPIHAIGVGEDIDDLQPFDPEEFVQALLGLDNLAGEKS